MNACTSSMHSSNSSVKRLPSAPTNQIYRTTHLSIQITHLNYKICQLVLPHGQIVLITLKSSIPPQNSCAQQSGSTSALVLHLTTTATSPVNNLDGVSIMKPPPPPLFPLVIPELLKQSANRTTVNSDSVR